MKYNWFENKSVPLSFFILWAKGSWVSGVIGDPSNLLPNSQKVKSARTCFCTTNFNYRLTAAFKQMIVKETNCAISGTPQ